MIKPGDVVRLRSGGPRMTVIARNEDDRSIDCKWFSPMLKIEWARFPLDAVKPHHGRKR